MCGDDSNRDGFDVMVCRELERWALAAPGVKASFIAGMLGYSTQVIVASLRRLERDGFAKRSRIFCEGRMKTVLHAVRKIEGLLKQDSQLAADIAGIQRRIGPPMQEAA